MGNQINGGVITPTKLNIHSLEYLTVFAKCFNELKEYYEIDEDLLFLEYRRAQHLLCLYCNYLELQFYKRYESDLGLMPRMIALEAMLSGKDIKHDILTQAKADSNTLNLNDLLTIVEPTDKQTYYVSFEIFLNATRLVKLYVESALRYEHCEKLLFAGDECIRSLKAYHALLKELGITVKKQVLIPNLIKKIK